MDCQDRADEIRTEIVWSLMGYYSNPKGYVTVDELDKIERMADLALRRLIK